MDNKVKRERGCKLTLNAGEKEFTLRPFQSPRGLRHNGERPDSVEIDCCEKFNQIQLLQFIEYLQTVVCAMRFEKE